jgi:anti-sigma regulatory factor (Ser/Thr protein kinase)
VGGALRVIELNPLVSAAKAPGTPVAMADHTLELTLPPEPDSVARARTQVCNALTPDLDEECVEKVRLLISEVVTNAVRHGSHDRPVELRAHWNSEVRIAVCDHGEDFTPHPRLGHLDEPGGFGLYLVGRLADRWGVDTDDGTTVWFVLRRR